MSVIWKVVDTDDNGRKVIVEFTYENNYNKVGFIWNGNKDDLIYRINQAAKQYEKEWAFPAPSSDEVLQILNLSGTSADIK